MHTVDTDGSLAPHITDPRKEIPKAHLTAVCKKDQPGMCRYVGTTPKFCFCAKHTPLKAVLGDNCPGLGQ